MPIPRLGTGILKPRQAFISDVLEKRLQDCAVPRHLTCLASTLMRLLPAPSRMSLPVQCCRIHAPHGIFSSRPFQRSATILVADRNLCRAPSQTFMASQSTVRRLSIQGSANPARAANNNEAEYQVSIGPLPDPCTLLYLAPGVLSRSTSTLDRFRAAARITSLADTSPHLLDPTRQIPGRVHTSLVLSRPQPSLLTFNLPAHPLPGQAHQCGGLNFSQPQLRARRLGCPPDATPTLS